MKIIFLDIDGVLNSDTWQKTDKYKKRKDPEKWFDPYAINLFNKLINETKAKVVLTSTWRLKYSIEEMRKIFSNVEIKCDLVGFTPDLSSNNDYVVRGNEILKWCKDNRNLIGTSPMNYTDFIILDDNNDMLLWQSNFFFQTDMLCGLSPRITREAIRMLKNKSE